MLIGPGSFSQWPFFFCKVPEIRHMQQSKIYKMLNVHMILPDVTGGICTLKSYMPDFLCFLGLLWQRFY